MIKSGGRLLLIFSLAVLLLANGAAPALAAWAAPVELYSADASALVSEEDFLSGSALAVQEDDAAHVFYVEKIGETYSLIHRTNKSGPWQKETIISSAARLGSPAAAVHNGNIYLAWARGSGRAAEIVYATDAGGAWSARRVTDNRVADVNPTIAVGRGGVYLAWIEAKRLHPDGAVKSGALRVRSNATGHWRTETIGKPYFAPYAPVVKVNGKGLAHIVFAGRSKLDGPAAILHAYQRAGLWRQEKIPANVDRRGRLVSAEMPSLALYKNLVYVSFMSVPDGTSGGPHIVLAVKKSGKWEFRGLTKARLMEATIAPLLSVSRGRIRLIYSNEGFGANGALKSELRYIELADGRMRGEKIESETVMLDPYSAVPPVFTVFIAAGLEERNGLVHATYLRLAVDLTNQTITGNLRYTGRDPN